MSKRSGAANNFQRDYLDANLKGTTFKGGIVTSVTNKYIHTDNGSYEKKGIRVSFEEKPETKNMIRPDTSGDTEGDRC
jgi:hypothetical protein